VLPKATVTIGSDEANDFVIRDGTVSRHHAVINFSQSRLLEIRDVGSTNGIFVNGRRILDPTLIDKGGTRFASVVPTSSFYELLFRCQQGRPRLRRSFRRPRKMRLGRERFQSPSESAAFL
jgi:hypothetical protein